MGKVCQSVDECDDDVLDVDVLLQLSTRLQEQIQRLQVELVWEHLETGREGGKEGGRGEEGGGGGRRGEEGGGGGRGEGGREVRGGRELLLLPILART